MTKTGKARLDRVLVARGLAPTRQQAQALILKGAVQVDGQRRDKAGTLVAAEATVTLTEAPPPYVGRGGVKLAGALDRFGLDPAGTVALDVGASTGGFTDCLLQRGATRVYAVDVGYGQIDWRLRCDPRVVVIERTNIRHMDPARIPEPIDLAVIDVSFIALEKVLPAVRPLLRPGGCIVALVKPQFEVGRRHVGRGGIVRDPALHQAAVDAVRAAAAAIGLRCDGSAASPLPGQKGNLEFFIHLVNATTV